MRSKKPADYTKLCYVIAKVCLDVGRLPSLKNLKSFVFKQQINKRRLLGLDNDLVREAYLEVRKELYKIDKEAPIVSEVMEQEAEKATAEVRRMGRLELPKSDLNADLEKGLDGEEDKVNKNKNIENKKDNLL